MGRPDEGTIVIEPVENGWLVQVWEEPDLDIEDAEEDEDEEEDEDCGYDPSAAFAAAQQMTPAQAHRMVTHVHMHDHGPEPRRFVFSNVTDLNAFVAEKNTEIAARIEAEKKLRAEIRAKRLSKDA